MAGKQYFKYKGKDYLIRSGKKGGLFILKNKKKKYIKSLYKLQKGGNNISKSIQIYTTINNKLTNILNIKNIDNDEIVDTPLFKDCDDMDDHNKFMADLSSKNLWFYSDEKTQKERYYGSCFIWNSKQRSWNKNQKCKISDVMETWLTETLSIECKMALIIYWFLKLYRIYGKKIDLIVKDIHCRECESNAFDTRSAINIDGDDLFKSYNNINIPPQQNIIETMNVIQNINRQFGYIRSNFGYLPMNKIGTSNYILTSPQGHNIMISCNQNKSRLAVYGPINIYEPNSRIDIENNLGKYMISNNLEEWLSKVLSEGAKNLEDSQKRLGNTIPENYEVVIDGDKTTTVKYQTWFGGINFYNISYNLPNNFI